MNKHENSGHPSEDEDILTRCEAAQFVRVKLRTLDYWRSHEGLPCHRIGRTILFRRPELIRFVESHPGEGPEKKVEG